MSGRFEQESPDIAILGSPGDVAPSSERIAMLEQFARVDEAARSEGGDRVEGDSAEGHESDQPREQGLGPDERRLPEKLTERSTLEAREHVRHDLMSKVERYAESPAETIDDEREQRFADRGELPPYEKAVVPEGARERMFPPDVYGERKARAWFQEAVNTYQGEVTVKTYGPGDTLYRVFDEDGKIDGSYWTEAPPAHDEGEMRHAAGLPVGFNGDGCYVKWTIPEGVSFDALVGQARPMRPDESSDMYYRGGGEQVFLNAELHNCLDYPETLEVYPTDWAKSHE